MLLISDTPFHTEHASFLRQWGTERQLSLRDVNTTHSVPVNMCGGYSTTAQHLNLDFDGRCACVGSAVCSTLCDGTVHLDHVKRDALIIYSTVTQLFICAMHSQADSKQKKKKLVIKYEIVLLVHSVIYHPRDQRAFAQFIRLRLPQDGIAFIAFIISQSIWKVIAPCCRAAEAMTVLIENVLSPVIWWQ